MKLLAGQEDDIPGTHARLLIFRPHVPFPVQHDDRLFVQMAMGSGFRGWYVTDELRDEVGTDALVHENLEIARAHRGALLRVDRHDALRKLSREAGGHCVQPTD